MIHLSLHLVLKTQQEVLTDKLLNKVKIPQTSSQVWLHLIFNQEFCNSHIKQVERPEVVIHLTWDKNYWEINQCKLILKVPHSHLLGS